jgi:hypothetical protein
MIFHMVRREIGDEAFWRALRAVATDFAGKRAGWEDFETAFEEASGKDLTAFFAAWLDRKGGPVLALENAEISEFCGAIGEIVQRGEPWPVTVDVVLRRGEEVVKRQTVRCEGERTRFDLGNVKPNSGLTLDLDPDWHLFRLYPAEAIPACLNATVEDREKLVVPVEAYAKAAARATAKKGGDVKAPADVTDEDLAGRSLLLLGAPWENPVVAKLLAEGAPEVAIDRESIRIGERTWKGKALSLLLSFRHPKSPERFVTVYLDLDRGALRRAPRFFFYGWDGFVVYDGGRPVERGALRAAEDLVILPDPTGRERKGSALPDDQAAAPGEARKLLRFLCSLEGRGAGQRGERRAAELVAMELLRAGWTVRIEPFAFEVVDVAEATLRIGDRKIEVTPFVWCDAMDEHGVVMAFRDLHVVPLPAADDREGWLPLTYPSRLPPALAARLEKARAAGQPADAWRAASGAQSRVVRPEGAPGFAVAADPALLEGIAADTAVALHVRFVRRTIVSANVVARLGEPPLGPRSSEAGPVVLGAHLDGLGREGDRVFECADDNASGVTALILAARELAGSLPSGRVLAVAFGAEEWGLRGSRAFLPALAASREPFASGPPARAMINLDTIGRQNVNDVHVIGRSKHPELAAPVLAALAKAGFGTGKDIDRMAFRHGSDFWPFHVAGMPAIGLWSSDYRVMNTAADTLDAVSPEKVARIADVVVEVVRQLASE